MRCEENMSWDSQYENDKYEIKSRFSTDYDYLRTIGSGNFAKVYECQNKLDGVKYAVKVTNEIVNSNCFL
jgi:serine/threonine protein kinase